jgi:hypothetical protein
LPYHAAVRILTLAALGVLVLLLLLACMIVILRRWGASVLREMRERTALRGEDGLRSEPLASFRGLLSDGIPLRGNAVVLLTARALYVVRLWPHREFVIPIERMVRIEVSRSFMGRTDRSGFLIVRFRDGEREDEIGLTIRKVVEWVGEIVKAARPHLEAIREARRIREEERPTSADGHGVQ